MNVFPEDFGAVGDGQTNDFGAFQNALLSMAATGGELTLTPGRTYRLNVNDSSAYKGVLVPNGVIIQGNDATLEIHCDGNVYGLRLANRAGVRDCTIDVVTSTNLTASGGIYHCPITIGSGYDDVRVDGLHSIHGFIVENVICKSAREGWVAVIGYGDLSGGLIDGVTVESTSSSCRGGVHFDWAPIGEISSLDAAASRAAFDDVPRRGYTTHPHDITIRNVKGGVLTRTDCHWVRLSGCYDIRVEDIAVESLTGAHNNVSSLLYVHAGDLGFEFAPDEVKAKRSSGIRLSRGVASECIYSYGVYADFHADNITAQAATYPPANRLLDPINRCNLLIEDVSVYGDGTGPEVGGFFVKKIEGATLRNCHAFGFTHGFMIYDDAHEVQVTGGSASLCQRSGLLCGNTDFPVSNVHVERFRAYHNNLVNGDWAHIQLFATSHVTVADCLLGKAGETALYGIWCADSVTGLRCTGNHVQAIKAGSAGYRIGTTTSYAVLREWRANTAVSGTGITAMDSNGVNIITVDTRVGTDGVARRLGRCLRAALTSGITPTAGTWAPGERIEFDDPVSGGYVGTVCVPAGTWKRYGLVT